MRCSCARASAFLFLSALALAAAEPIAVIKSVTGSVTIVRAGQALPAAEGAHIQLQDVLRTTDDGRVGILFSDGTRVSLDPKTELNIERYQFAPAQKQYELLLKLMRGIAAYVSGKIAQFSPAAVQIETPVAIIGLRGTSMIVSVGQ